MRQLRLALHALIVSVVVGFVPVIASATSTVGLYSDTNGSSCSFSGNDAGPLSVYVVIKPDGQGITGARFSAPIPACLGASFIEENEAPGILSIGSSATGISLGLGYCAFEPTYALEIKYLRTSTTPCCEFAIQPDPFVGIIEGTDCSFTSLQMAGVTSRFNADETCPCHDLKPPFPPHTPDPANDATWVATGTALSWLPSAFDGDIAEYDVYLGTTPTPGFVATVQTPTYQPAQPLVETEQYYWRVVVRDTEGLETLGPLWTFYTRVGNLPPAVPNNPSPANGTLGHPTNLTLTWVSNDPDGDPVEYDVYFGAVSPPPLVATDLTTPQLARTGLSYLTQYYWRVVARDIQGHETSGSEWSFFTRLSNTAPNIPTVTSPAQNATNVDINANPTWNGTDPNGDQLTFDVYFGTTNPPPLVVANHPFKFYEPGTMAFSTVHFWRVVASDGTEQTDGPLWAFTTAANQPPAIPSSPQPANNANSVALTPNLFWTSTDELPGLKFDVYFGTTNPPPLVASNHTQNSYTPGLLTATTSYFWKIVARDAQGLERTGPVWTFATVANPVPYGPTPPNNGFGAAPMALKWSVSDPLVYPVTCDVYFGTTNPPPLVASNVGSAIGPLLFVYAPGGAIVSGTRYYWKVFAHTIYGGAMGPDWSFVGQASGDVNMNGALDVGDAECALQIALGNIYCAANGATNLADVNCEINVTPRDALCIHKRAVGQSCPFCFEQLTTGTALFPSITRSSLTQVGNTMTAVLAVSGVASFEAFSFRVSFPPNVPLVAVLRKDATNGYTALDFRQGYGYAIVGGYSLNPPNTTSTTDFIELRFQIGGTFLGTIYTEAYADDLKGAQILEVATGVGGKGGGGGVPVIFTRFDAKPDGDGVRIGWEFQHDDALDSYAIYRSVEGRGPVVPVVQGAVTDEAGSYLDRTVEPGQTYRYEMMVRASDGDEFRSPMVTIEVPGLDVELGANHPNPFNPQTTIPYVVPVGGPPVRVRLAIYDTAGRLVRELVNESQAGGARSVVWRGDAVDGKTVTSGIYFAVLQVGNEQRTRKLVLLK